ncbi:hypothetical protein QEJ31_12945 [Pigmentibacter sp. JX0631]|uniref:Mom family adenine methylcarbamoylation protein n=1 Tax=Pigmentibacter sp. JX0631 TaxID=2976982 RepID=UPI002468E802|nr:hypothetical protein [Pigmentibacter sp. JX0631]WGL59431.1 hypothetical protein QEJ31_12945 [Pigmentibacter sp. JX0631]
MFNSNECEIKIISRKECLDFIKLYHYQPGLPAVTWNYGIFYNGIIIGAIAFAPPSSPTIYKLFRGIFKKKTIFQLSKFALSHLAPKNTGSYALSKCLKIFKKERPKIECIITYCDMERGYKGTVFRAANWIDIGLSCKGGAQAYYHGRKRITAREFNRFNNLNIKNHYRKEKRTIKIRYIYLFDRKIHDFLLELDSNSVKE